MKKSILALAALVSMSALSSSVLAGQIYSKKLVLAETESVKLDAFDIFTFQRVGGPWFDRETCPGTGISAHEFGFRQDLGPSNFLITQITNGDDFYASAAVIAKGVPFNGDSNGFTTDCLNGSIPVMKIKGTSLTANGLEKPATLQISIPKSGEVSVKVFTRD